MSPERMGFAKEMVGDGSMEVVALESFKLKLVSEVAEDMVVGD